MLIKEQFRKMIFVVMIGIGAGFFCMLFRQEQLLLKTGFLDSYTLSPIKYLEIDYNVLLGYVLRQRLLCSVLLSILATTYLGIIVSYLYLILEGTAFGLLIGAAILRYGLKGLLFIVVSLIPHQFVLFPCFLLIVYVSCSLCRFLYFKDVTIGVVNKKNILWKHFVILFLCNVVVIIGSYIESYVNPQLLKFVLKFF